MLKKLIAHDFSCTWRLATLLLVTSGVGALLAMGFGFIAYSINFDSLTDSMYLLVYSGLNLGETFASMLAYFSAGALILMVAIHYYKKFISDEAYLTFTLPATPGQHLLSKMISGFVWNVVGAVMLIIDSVLIQLPSELMRQQDIFTEMTDEIVDNIVDASSLAEDLAFLGAILLLGIVFLFAELGLIYLCLTIGGVIANKQKAIAGVGLYWLTNGFVSGVIVFVGIIISAIVVSPFDLQGLWPIVLVLYVWAIVVAVFGVIFYFINRNLLTKKLNLP